MTFSEIKDYCMKKETSCKECPLLVICGKPAFTWNDELLKKADMFVEKYDEIEETMRRR